MIPKSLLTLLVMWVTYLTVVGEDKVVILDDPEVSLKMRVHLIRTSTKTLDIATYIYGNDEVSTQMLSELIRAAKRGVKIRMIIDALNNKIPKELSSLLLSLGIRIKLFNAFSLKKHIHNVTRMHSKITVSDQSVYIVGGRNIVNTYFYIGNQKNFRDREVYIEGRSGLTATRAFEELWFSAVVKELKEYRKNKKTLKNIKEANQFFEAWDTIPQAKKIEISKTISRLKFQPASDVRIIWDRPESYKYVNKNTTNYLIDKINSCQSNILIESPYIVFSDDIYKALQSAINRGVKVQIVTNSLATSDSYLVLATYFKERDQLINLGFDIWEYISEDEYLHTKMFVFDDKFVTIGSYNLDMLSAQINTECMVQFIDAELVQQALGFYKNTKSKARKAQVNTYIPTLFEDEVTYYSLKKYAIIKALQWTVSPYIREYL